MNDHSLRVHDYAMVLRFDFSLRRYILTCHLSFHNASLSLKKIYKLIHQLVVWILMIQRWFSDEKMKFCNKIFSLKERYVRVVFIFIDYLCVMNFKWGYGLLTLKGFGVKISCILWNIVDFGWDTWYNSYTLAWWIDLSVWWNI